MKIFLDGYFANNFGDDLMIQGLLKKYPNYDFVAMSSKNEVKNTYKNYNNIKFLNSFDNEYYDYYIFIGGSIYEFVHLKNIRYHFHRLKRMLLSKRKGSKILTLGANLGNYNLNIGKKIIMKELEIQDLITVRDNYSFNLLKENGVKTQTYLIQDIAFEVLMDYKEKIKKKNNSNVLGISSFKLNDNSIIAIANIVKNYISKSEGNTVRIFSFNPKSQQDHFFAKKIKKEVPELYHKSIELVDYTGDVNRFLEEISGCSKFVAVRFHSAIIAYIFSIPFLPIVYSNKTENFLNDINYQGERFHTDNPFKSNDLQSAFKKIEEAEYRTPNDYLGRNYQKHFDVFDKFMTKKEENK